MSFPKSWFFCQRSVTRIATVSDNVNSDWLQILKPLEPDMWGLPLHVQENEALLLSTSSFWLHETFGRARMRDTWFETRSGGNQINEVARCLLVSDQGCNGQIYESCFYTYSTHASDLYAAQHTKRSIWVRRPKGEIYPWCEYVRALVCIKRSHIEGYTRA